MKSIGIQVDTGSENYIGDEVPNSIYVAEAFNSFFDYNEEQSIDIDSYKPLDSIRLNLFLREIGAKIIEFRNNFLDL